MRPRTLLLTLLHRYGLSAPDGRLLCLYRCPDSEFSMLNTVLREAAHVHWEIWPTQERVCLPPCFCLYAAEWWRRNYESGPWAWHDILESTGLGAAFPRQRLYRIVHQGLTYWKRPILTVASQHAFLVTLACEGGVPLKLLHRDGTHLQRYFRALLHEFQIYGRRGVSATQLAARVASVLPLSLRQEVVYELSGNLIEQIWELQTVVGETRTPIEDLDRRDPQWRERLPIVVSDTTAQALLNNLVQDASRLAGHAPSELWVSGSLVRTSGGWMLRRQVMIPPSVSGVGLAHLLGVSAKELPSRLQLSYSSRTGERRLLALITRRTTGDDGLFAFETPSEGCPHFTGPEALSAIRLHVLAGRQTFEVKELRGGEELSELPWTFVARRGDAETLEFVGEGSVRTRFPEAYVAVPEQSKVVPGEHALLQHAGTMPQLGRTVYRLEGEAVFREGDNISHIRTRSATEEAYAYALEGTFLAAGAYGSEVYRGVPRVVFHTPSGIKRMVPENELQWRVGNSRSPWRSFVEAPVGRVTIRHTVGGETRCMANVEIVPGSSRLVFLPGKDSKHGTILLQGFHAAEVGLAALPNVQAVIEPQDADWRLALAYTDEPPSSLTLHMRWSLGQALSLTIPFPAKGGRFLARDTRVLAPNATVHVERLSGVTAQVLIPEAYGTFFVTAELKAEAISAALVHTCWTQEPLIAVVPGTHAVDLQVIQDACRLMFTMTERLDAYVQLSLVSGIGMELGRRLRVTRYDAFLTPNHETGHVELLETALAPLEPGTVNRLAMKAFPLWSPETALMSLERVDEHRWCFDPENRQPGPWLVTGWDGDWSRVRPLLWSVPGNALATENAASQPTDALSVEHVVRITDRDARRETCDALVEQLATVPSHPGWAQVAAYINILPSFPATTFDLIVRLAQHPDAAALALLQSRQDAFEALWSSLEQLPFSWALVPVSSWLRAAERYAITLRKVLQPVIAELSGSLDDLVLSAFNTFFSEAPLRIPGLQCVVELIWEKVFQRPRHQSQYLHLACSAAGREALRSMILPEAEQFLLQSHKEDYWPSSNGIGEWLRHHADIPAPLAALWNVPLPGAGFRAPVLNAPVIAALTSVCNIPVSRDVVFHVRRLRDFDVAWFEAAYGCILAIAMGYLLEHDEGFCHE